MKNCPFCNAEIFDEAIFCVQCKSSLPTNEVASTNPNVKICSACGNECDNNAILCVKCGTLLDNKVNTNNNQVKGKERIVSIIAIVLCAIGALSGIIVVISSLVDGSYFANIISSIVSAIGAIVVTVGLIAGKKNKLPAIGYFISALSTLISVLISGGVISYKLLSIFSIIQVVLVALLYLGNKSIEKLWVAPIALSLVLSVVYMIVNLSNEAYTSGYYYSYFDWGYFLVDAATRIGSVIGVGVTCLNAKLNWCSNEQ